MKTIGKSMMMVLIVAVIATFTSCTKDPFYLVNPDDNVLVHNNGHYDMECRFAPPFHDNFDIVAYSTSTFLGSPVMGFRFYNIPYEMLDKEIDLAKSSDLTLAFDFCNNVHWFTSPEKVCGYTGASYEDDYTEYRDESPFKSGTMTLTEDEKGITFILRGVLKNGESFRMKLFAPAE
jgi:hypothetical protein